MDLETVSQENKESENIDDFRPLSKTQKAQVNNQISQTLIPTTILTALISGAIGFLISDLAKNNASAIALRETYQEYIEIQTSLHNAKRDSDAILDQTSTTVEEMQGMFSRIRDMEIQLEVTEEFMDAGMLVDNIYERLEKNQGFLSSVAAVVLRPNSWGQGRATPGTSGARGTNRGTANCPEGYYATGVEAWDNDGGRYCTSCIIWTGGHAAESRYRAGSCRHSTRATCRRPCAPDRDTGKRRSDNGHSASHW